MTMAQQVRVVKCCMVSSLVQVYYRHRYRICLIQVDGHNYTVWYNVFTRFNSDDRSMLCWKVFSWRQKYEYGRECSGREIIMHIELIGWTFLNESSTSSVCSCTDASTTKLLGTWWTTAHQYPTLLIVNGYVLPVVMKSLFHVTGSVYIWTSGICRCWPDCLELFAKDMWDPKVSEDQSLKTFLFAQY